MTFKQKLGSLLIKLGNRLYAPTGGIALIPENWKAGECSSPTNAHLWGTWIKTQAAVNGWDCSVQYRICTRCHFQEIKRV